MPLTDTQCSLVKDALVPFAPAVIYLFGSYGGPAEHPASDIDIAFLPTVAADPVACFYISNRLAEQLRRDIDLVNLSQASTVLAKEVFRTGTPIDIQNPHLHQEFEMRTLSDYARLNEERQAMITP
jgi:predicted nucleotidyltransferase